MFYDLSKEITMNIIKKYLDRRRQRAEAERLSKLEQKILIELQRQACESGNHVYGGWVTCGIVYQWQSRHCKYCNYRQERFIRW